MLCTTMGCSQSELFNRFSAEEIEEFYYYYQIEPWGAKRDNLHFAMLLQMIKSLFTKKGSRKPKLEDFMLTVTADQGKDVKDGKQVQDPEEQTRNIMAMFGFTDEDKG